MRRQFDRARSTLSALSDYIAKAIISAKLVWRLLLIGLCIALIYNIIDLRYLRAIDLGSAPGFIVPLTRKIFESSLSAIFAIAIVRVLWDVLNQYYLDRRLNAAFLSAMASEDADLREALNNIDVERRDC